MIDLSTTGVWSNTDAMSASEAAEFAGRVESLGYSTLWIPESTGRDPFAHFAHLANHTTSLGFATGIANIHHRHPGVMKQAAMTLAEQTSDRFLLGLGVSHAPLVEGLRQLDYTKPIATMRAYLDAMHAAPTSLPPGGERFQTVLAALGPKMLALAAERTDGAHPYLTTPEHTAQAREILGPDKLLLVEQKVFLGSDPDEARRSAATAVELYTTLPNYVNNWLRLGFTQTEIDDRAERFLDAMVVWGDEDHIRAGVEAHYAAGATHVCVQPIHTGGRGGKPDWRVLEALAPVNA